MKLTIPRNDLIKLADTVGGAVSPRSTLPVLGNILLDAKDGILTAKATNLEVGIQAQALANVGEDGATTVPALTFTDILRTLDGGLVKLETAKNYKLRLTCDRTDTQFATIAADEFPPLEITRDVAEISGATFKAAAERVTPAAATDEARPILQGVWIHNKDRRMALASADGFRLALVKLSIEAPFSAIVPATALKLMAKLAGESVKISCQEGQAHFWSGAAGVLSQTIQGSFPDIYQIIPEKYTTLVELAAAPLIRAVRQAEIFSREGAHLVRLHITADSVTVAGQSDETGQAATELSPDFIEGEPLDIGVNARFLLDALEACRSERVQIRLTSDAAAFTVAPLGSDGFTAVLMPMALTR